MVSRRQKLLAAGSVLGVGLAVAMLFRRGNFEAPGPLPGSRVVARAELPPLVMATAVPVPVSVEPQFSPQPPVPATIVRSITSAAPPVELPTTLLDSVSPVVSVEPVSAPSPAATASSGRPVYAVETPAEIAPSAVESGYRVHVIHNGDTLERLAERYLSDGARALELFDLNRDVLANPHLLPLGVELRIPISSSAETSSD